MSLASLLSHFEARLGRLVYGWSKSPDGEPMPFQVARFEGGVFEGVVGFATIGLSRAALLFPVTGRSVRLELVVCERDERGERNVPALLQQIGLTALGTGRALRRGELIEFGDTVVAGASMTALYATLPAYFDQAFSSCPIDEGGEAAIVWLVPVHPSEAAFVRTRGWQAFEHLLEQQGPDLFDPLRPPLAPAR